ncbi:tyrosyl-DNA phosphodiesterase-domain-containing protein [Dendryphion nanum]|uniref:Tyrosyl-DNA phosphodiesterase-domain-containing protein n=1 Tax=Dendryphion nanum TaxID=256645 RepID=A0A9P9E8F9_9PLEO|nr:tyrosyl-DNA phosphodiesterase-domain-containing protein [Dendryphion nanum]
MGSNDIPPPHVNSNYLLIHHLIMGTGGLLWTTTYVLMTRQSFKDKSYSMPLFSLAFNFAWEIIFALYVAETFLEKTVFVTWMLVDLGLVYAVLEYGKNEWAHAPVVVRHIGKIFMVSVMWWCCALWAICSWWVDPRNPVNPKEGKIYNGKVGPDTTELGWWTSLLAQVILSVMLLAQIVTRGHSGGASYSIWATRFFGSLIGLNGYYGYCWYVWPEAHGYFTNPFAVCLWITWVVADIAYLVVLRDVKTSEIVLKNGRKVRREAISCIREMAFSSDEDEDFKRAIAMSLDSSQASRAAPVIDLESDDDEDDELHRAIALSLQDNEKTELEPELGILRSNLEPTENPPFKYTKAKTSNKQATHNSVESTTTKTPTPRLVPGLSSLDRKSMEQQRLARLAKRKRSPSPDPPSKIVRKEKSPKELESNSALQFPHGTIKRTWAYKNARTNDIKLEEVLQAATLKIAVISAFNWEDEWLLHKLPPTKINQFWVMSCKGKELQDKWLADAAANEVPNRKIRFPPLDGQAQHMHSKLLLLSHPTHLRVVIPTANMIRVDWGETPSDWQPAVMENTVFMIDLPRRQDGEVGKKDDLTWFGKELLSFLEAQNIDPVVTKGVLKFDFSSTQKIEFVHSIPGHLTEQYSGRTGLPGLSTAVRRLGLDHVQDLQLDYATSSLGALKESTLRQLYRASRGERSLLINDTQSKVLENVRVYYPTNDAVAQSTGGPDCGGIITLGRKDYDNDAFPKSCLRQHVSNRPGLLSHNKILLARGCKQDGKPFAWVYVGSANLSESAWGSQRILKSGKEGKFTIRNWESGVLVPVADSAFEGVKSGEVPPLSVFKDTIEIPFECPGEGFGNKQPWFFRP